MLITFRCFSFSRFLFAYRNPDGEPRAWCYTTNETDRWDFCDVPACGYCGTGIEDVEESCGQTCYEDSECEEGQACIFGSECGFWWGEGAAPPEQYDCGTLSLQQSDYRGTINETSTGIPCQRWDEQEPHGHDRTAENYPIFGLEENYCRYVLRILALWAWRFNYSISSVDHFLLF